MPLESRTVRFIDNFSVGTRGATSTEYPLSNCGLNMKSVIDNLVYVTIVFAINYACPANIMHAHTHTRTHAHTHTHKLVFQSIHTSISHRLKKLITIVCNVM